MQGYIIKDWNAIFSLLNTLKSANLPLSWVGEKYYQETYHSSRD